MPLKCQKTANGLIKYLTWLSSFSSVRRSSTTHRPWPALPRLIKPSVEEFRAEAFEPGKPYHLSKTFSIPASKTWISQENPVTLRIDHFRSIRDDLFLPMELTTSKPEHTFIRTTAPLALFLSYLKQLHDSSEVDMSMMPRMYVAQAPLVDLPSHLGDEIPTPEFVLCVGKGDIYDSSLWMGPAFAARTPLHRDPNPNILFQLAGTKAVRILPPDAGADVYQETRRQLASGSDLPGASMGTMRGDEMMGKEGQLLDEVIWEHQPPSYQAQEAILSPGDGIFIPEGWWHSIRGIGSKEINISANWWFR